VTPEWIMLWRRILTLKDIHPTIRAVRRSLAKRLPGALFQEVTRYGKIGNSPLHKNSISLIVKRAAERAGYDPSTLGGHSLRAGLATYDAGSNQFRPSRLQGVSAYRGIERPFSVGDRLQFTAPNRELGVANRDLATVEQIKDGRISVRMDNGKAVTFDANEMRHFDHGYAVTSHSSQGLTADRVLVNIDTTVHPELIAVSPMFPSLALPRTRNFILIPRLRSRRV
jgi:hypothetical protein